MIASDIATCFGYSAQLQEAGGEPLGRTPGNGPYVLNPRSRLAAFDHDPIELLGLLHSGLTDLEKLACALQGNEWEALLYVMDGEVEIKVLSGPQVAVLKRIEAGIGLQPEDADLEDFLSASVSEGLRALR